MRRHIWDPPERTLEGLLFDGATNLLKMLDSLVRRPRWRWSEHPLPLIYLAQHERRADPLDAIADRLARARRKQFCVARVPAQLTDTAAPCADPELETLVALRRVLDAAVVSFAGKRHGVSRIRFPHYGVASLLVGLYTGRPEPDSPDGVADQTDALRKFLRGRLPAVQPIEGVVGQLNAQVPWYIVLAARTALWAGRALVDKTWPVRRWFARHEIVGGDAITSLARSFAARTRKADHACQLLVDAMLQDLRVAYRRTWLPGTRRGRLAYPVLLIDGALRGTAGLRLLELINSSRNRVVNRRFRPDLPYRRDPLLVVAVGDRDGLALLRADRRITDAQLSPPDLGWVHPRWRTGIDQDGNRRWWVLPLLIPDQPPPSGIRASLTEQGAPAGPRSFAAPVAGALALILAGSVASFQVGYLAEHCGTLDSRLTTRPLGDGRSQCVGVSDGGYKFFRDVPDVEGLGPDAIADLKAVESDIVDTNAQARAVRGYETVVYLSILSSQNAESYRAALEDLLGLAAAQRKSMGLGMPVQVLLANAGEDMIHGELAANAIAAARSADQSIVAVVGMGISRIGTRQAMLRLAQARLPIVGTLISATELATDTTQFYFQVGPTNQREAAVLAYHAAQARGTVRAEIYYSGDPEDLYSTDLKEQLKSALSVYGIRATEQRYRASPRGAGVEIRELGRRACGLARRSAVAVYAGRAERFDEFVDGMTSRCQGSYPRLLSGDDVTRNLLARTEPLPNGLVVDYAALASSMAWGDTCAIGQVPQFFSHYGALSTDLRLSALSDVCARTRDGAAMLAFDALDIVMQAVGRAGGGGDRPSPDAVWGQLQQMHGPGLVTGSTGVVDFAYGRTVPRDKVVVMLRAEGAKRGTRLFHCGRLNMGDDPAEAAGCPTDPVD